MSIGINCLRLLRLNTKSVLSRQIARFGGHWGFVSSPQCTAGTFHTADGTWCVNSEYCE